MRVLCSIGCWLVLATGLPSLAAAQHAASAYGSDAAMAATALGNSAPVLTTAAPIVRQRGSVGSVSAIATVSDAESSAQDIVVTAISVTSELAVVNITNTTGAITGAISAGCTMAIGSHSVMLRATDPGALTDEEGFVVEVAANAPPTLHYYPTTNVAIGTSAVTVAPSVAPSDNGAIVSIAASVSASGSNSFTGTVSVDSLSGAVTISNPGPVGNYMMQITATDNCGDSSQRSAYLSIRPSVTPPTLVAKAVSSRIQDPRTRVMVANVVDPERDWTVISIDGASGSLRNSVYVEDLRIDQRGTLTADVYASCLATDADFLLKVTDSTNLSGEATLHVTVLPNTPPVLSYPTNSTVLLNHDLTISPSAGPSDNSQYVDVLWQSFGTYGGVAAVTNLGVVTIPRANPEGAYTLIAFSEDNCGLRTSAEVPFTVLGENIFANSFEAIARTPAKMKLPLGAIGETMRLPLPMFASKSMEGDAIVDLIEFEIDGSRVLLQARNIGGRDEFRVINFNAPVDATEGVWMNGTQPRQLWFEWRGREGWVDAILQGA